MNEKFRISKSILRIGIVGTLTYVAATVGYASVLFLREPRQYGFEGEHSIALVGWMGIFVFGAMALLGIYLLLDYIEYFEINGTIITIRTVLRKRQFDLPEIRQLVWTEKFFPGRPVFHLSNAKVRLDLNCFSRPDQLTIIRRLRGLVSQELQEGWPLFCYQIALPLRDGSRSGVAPQAEAGATIQNPKC